MYRIDTPGASLSNTFTDGNPSTGTPATQVSGDWLTAIQEEIIAVIIAGAGTLAKGNSHQLRDAIVALIAGGGVSVNAAAVAIADAADWFSGTNVESALAQLGAKIYAGTLNTNQLRRTVVSLTATAVNNDATHNENPVECTNAASITYTVVPDSTYNAPIGSAITIFQGGAGQVTAVAGSGVSLKYPSVFFQAKTLGQEANMVLVKTAANTWRLGGMLAGV